MNIFKTHNLNILEHTWFDKYANVYKYFTNTKFRYSQTHNSDIHKHKI